MMSKTATKLEAILSEEKDRIRPSYSSNEVVFVLIELLRSAEYHYYLLNHDINIPQKELLKQKYIFGWPLAFSIFYKDLVLHNDIPQVVFDSNNKEWIDILIQNAGCQEITRQYLHYFKAGLVSCTESNENEFQFEYINEKPGIEQYEKLSLLYFHSLVEEQYRETSDYIIKNIASVRKKLRRIVFEAPGGLIAYKATKEIEEFYSKFGHLVMSTTQVLDDFNEEDKFGNYVYSDYLVVIEYLFKTALIHRDCCMALSEKTSHRVHLRNILTYCFSKEMFIDFLCSHLNWDKQKCTSIISCFTLNRENIDYHFNSPGVSPPPFVLMGNDLLAQSTTGMLHMPVFFLNKELKRRFSKDYFEAVNRREARFRDHLYSFFPQERILKVFDNVVIQTNGTSTDIDAALYDTQRKVLGLFQLKWQDSFYTSMKERFSKITNLIPKSIEWIDKIESWIADTDSKSILKTLRINSEFSEIDEVHIFVISRNHVHFTNQPLDNRAIWSSWFQLVEASAKIKDPSGSNPIVELATKLRFYDPNSRMNINPLRKPSPLSFSFSKYKISIG